MTFAATGIQMKEWVSVKAINGFRDSPVRRCASAFVMSTKLILASRRTWLMWPVRAYVINLESINWVPLLADFSKLGSKHFQRHRHFNVLYKVPPQHAQLAAYETQQLHSLCAGFEMPLINNRSFLGKYVLCCSFYLAASFPGYSTTTSPRMEGLPILTRSVLVSMR